MTSKCSNEAMVCRCWSMSIRFRQDLWSAVSRACFTFAIVKEKRRWRKSHCEWVESLPSSVAMGHVECLVCLCAINGSPTPPTYIRHLISYVMLSDLFFSLFWSLYQYCPFTRASTWIWQWPTSFLLILVRSFCLWAGYEVKVELGRDSMRFNREE